MPSSLVGLSKTLTWNDFTGVPDPQKPKLSAFTSATFVLPAIAPAKVPGAQDFQFADNIIVTITMNSSKSWKRPGIFANPASAGTLLQHEQGHYNIVALIARDLFIELMQLKGRTYPTVAAALGDLQPILTKFGGKAEKISVIYDSGNQTNHGVNASQQATWNGMITRAFTDPRTPTMSSPDGVPYKVPFLDVLAQNGIVP
jgi:hypothetical protein